MSTMNEIIFQRDLRYREESINRFIRKLQMYENDMDFECTTVLEECLKEQMLEVFKLAHMLKEGKI